MCVLMCMSALAADSIIPAVRWEQQTRRTQYGRIISCFGFQNFDWDTKTYNYVGTWYRYQKTDKSDLQSVGELVINNGVPEPCQTPNDLLIGTYYYYAEITATNYCIENGLIRGFADAKFQPNGSTTRAQLIMILWRMEGNPVVDDAMSYGDVTEDAWYREAIRWAASEDIAQGYDSEHFAPNDAVTREQMVSSLWHFAKWKGCNVNIGENTNILSYEDALTINEYAVPAMQWACGSGLLHGDDTNLLPKSGAARAQAATLMMHFCEECIK